MANVIASYAAKKVLGKQMDKYRSKAVAGDDVGIYNSLVNSPLTVTRIRTSLL